jgi:hypothetical protein
MPRESTAEKALRYISERRLRIVVVSETTIRAVIQGAELYRCGWDWQGDPNWPGDWFCGVRLDADPPMSSRSSSSRSLEKIEPTGGPG